MDSTVGVVHGLRLTMTGEVVRKLLDDRIEGHRRREEHWRRELARTPEEQTEEHPLLPDHMCEHEAERHAWRVEVLQFLREYVDPAAVYLLGEDDLAFGELLPPKPGSVAQEEYEERTSIGFNLERLTKEVGRAAIGFSRYDGVREEV